MKRIDSFFKKCDTQTTKKQHDDKEVKEDEAQPSNSEPKNHSSASKSSSDPVTAVKASRHFHPKWKATFPWVYIMEGEMFCQTCQECPRKSNDSSSFVSGCSNLKIESLKSHARSTGHVEPILSPGLATRWCLLARKL